MIQTDDMAKRTSQETLTRAGNNLRLLREAFGHSQKDWAIRLGISVTMLNRWEQGTRVPNIDVLARICTATRCTLDFIFRSYLGRDVDEELRARLGPALLAADSSAFVWHLAPAPSAPPASEIPAAPKKLARGRRDRHVSARRTPPSPDA